jgi:hypothetical protein
MVAFLIWFVLVARPRWWMLLTETWVCSIYTFTIYFGSSIYVPSVG